MRLICIVRDKEFVCMSTCLYIVTFMPCICVLMRVEETCGDVADVQRGACSNKVAPRSASSRARAKIEGEGIRNVCVLEQAFMH